MKTKILFLSMLLLTGLATGLAQSGTCGLNLTWTLENGTLTISGTGEMAGYWSYPNYAPWYSYHSSITTVAIGNGVKSIGDYAFDDCENLSSITIPNSVASIGWCAFRGCSNLTSITIPSSVTSIGSSAFEGCGLTSITIPSSVTSIGAGAFGSCSRLTAIDVDSENKYFSSEDGIMFNKAQTMLVCYPAGKTENSYAIPNGVTSIGRYAFLGCSTLTSITIPNSVTNIGGKAFSYCRGLTSITIPNSVTSIGGYAFSDCYSLSSITIPNSVTSIEVGAFRGCISLSSITIPSSVTSIGEEAFSDCSRLTSITIPNSVTSIGNSAFSYCLGLSSIYVEDGNQYFSSENGILFNKNKTMLVCYPAGKTENSYAIPNGVTSIEDYAFAYCSSLSSITIPNGVTSIGSYAFGFCSSLSSVTNLNPTPQSIQSYVFFLVNLSAATLYVPAEAKAAYQNADVWKNFGTIADYVPSAITAPAAANAVRIYPNPVSEGFRIDGIRESTTLTLINENGAVVLSQPVNDGEYVSVSSLAKGLYIVKLQTGNGTLEKKLIKM